MQVEKHCIQVQQLSVKRNRANAMKQKLLGTKEVEFIIQHIDNKSHFQEKIQQYSTSNHFLQNEKVCKNFAKLN